MSTQTTNLFSSYKTGSKVTDELNNNLTIVNAIIQKKNIKCIPEFYILGGAALVLHGLNYSSTLDIDTANFIDKSIRDDIELFINDNSAEVSILPFNYKTRAERIREDLQSIEVYLLSKEDLLVTKFISGRRKDFNAIVNSGILKSINVELFGNILINELEVNPRRKILQGLKYIGKEDIFK